MTSPHDCKNCGGKLNDHIYMDTYLSNIDIEPKGHHCNNYKPIDQEKIKQQWLEAKEIYIEILKKKPANIKGDT